MRGHLFLASIALASACASDSPDDDGPTTELDPGPEAGKEDGFGIPSLPVNGDYSASQAWTVVNQWEDTTTADAKKAGIAWPANSGLNWDQKFSAWVGSFEQTDSIDGFFQTIKVSTPFGKAVNGPKIDCADLALLLRISFAAWYRLPIYFVGYDHNQPVYFGHFGIRTASGPWSLAPLFSVKYSDFSSMPPAQYMANWPQDTSLRTRGVMPNDELPFLGPGARLGAFLDEIHLNKRAARLVFFAQAYLGSHNMVDSRNMYNIVPEALRTGDVLMYARSPTVDGHTTIVTRVEHLPGGLNVKAQSVYGNDPPAQPEWQSPGQTRQLFSSDEGGGPSLNLPYGGNFIYSHLGGGLKRYRVAKAKNGKWVNTWMAADEASWIDSTDFDKIGARVAQFRTMLGDPDPAATRDALVQVIEAKRQHLREHPSSCAARTAREDAFTQLYGVMSEHFGMDRAAVDAQFRTTMEDYVFAPLDYSKSRTCCWNSTNKAMTDIIMSFQQSQQMNGCVSPTVFKLTANSYDPFAAFATASGHGSEWRSWSQDEACEAAGRSDDVVLPDTGITPWCSLPASH
jgi:hypothetical protein